MKVERICKNCKKKFFARSADVNRGWGIFCSRSCKAKEQERRTGQHAQYLDDCTTDFVKFLGDDESVV